MSGAEGLVLTAVAVVGVVVGYFLVVTARSQG